MALAIAVGVGAVAGYVSRADPASRLGTRGGGVAAAPWNAVAAWRGLPAAIVSASSAYGCLRRWRRETRRRGEEREARAFFSKTSASGNKY